MGTTKAFKSVKSRSKKRIVVKKTRNINFNKWNNAKLQTKILLLIPKPNFNQHLHKRNTPIYLNSFETAEGKEERNRLEPLSHTWRPGSSQLHTISLELLIRKEQQQGVTFMLYVKLDCYLQ